MIGRQHLPLMAFFVLPRPGRACHFCGMLNEHVRIWLRSGGHFAAGLNLLAQTGANPRLHAQLQGYLKGQWVPDTAKAQLRTALRTWLGDQSKAKAQNPVNRKSRTSAIPAAANLSSFQSADRQASFFFHPSDKEEPPAIQSLRVEAKAWHKHHSELKGRLNLMVEIPENHSDAQRAEVATEIMTEVIPKLDGIYAQIKHWKETGKLPVLQAERDIVRETVEKMNRLQKILPPRISKLKKYLREGKRNGKELTADELVAYRKELVEKEGEVVRLKGELGV